jgi:tryptophan-rich sensory protein
LGSGEPPEEFARSASTSVRVIAPNDDNRRPPLGSLSPGFGRLGVPIVVTIAVAAVTNGALAAFGLNQPGTQHWPSFAPRGPVIGAVWIVLFAGMGAAFGLARSRRAVAGLIALCLAYPFYTHAIGGHLTELLGNIATFTYAAWLMTRLRAESRTATLLVGCVAAWIAFATALVIGLVQLNGWATPNG